MTEREIAEKMIADAKTMAKEGQAKLDTLDKPEKLKNLDYGFNMTGEPRVFLLKDGKVCAYDENGVQTQANANGPALGKCDSYYATGNVLADLKRNSEDLEDFSVGYEDGSDNSKVRCCIRHDNKIELKVGNEYFTAGISKHQEIHQKLGQLIAYAKRQQNKET